MVIVMETQSLINIIIAIVNFFGGWTLKIIWDALRAFQDADKDLTNKVSSIEVLVAGNYVSRDEFQKTIIAVFTKLDRIEDKIDHKADK